MRKKSRTGVVVALGVMGSLLAAGTAEGQLPVCANQNAGFNQICTATATQYKFTMTNFEFRIKGTNTFVSVTEGKPGQDFDVGSANVSQGAEVGNFISEGTLPVGTYDAVQPTLAVIWFFTGEFTGGGGFQGATTGSDPFCNTAGAAPAQAEFDFSTVDIPQGSDFQIVGGELKLVDTTPIEQAFPETQELVITGDKDLNVTTKFNSTVGVVFDFTGVCSARLGPLGVLMTVELVDKEQP